MSSDKYDRINSLLARGYGASEIIVALGVTSVDISNAQPKFRPHTTASSASRSVSSSTAHGNTSKAPDTPKRTIPAAEKARARKAEMGLPQSNGYGNANAFPRARAAAVQEAQWRKAELGSTSSSQASHDNNFPPLSQSETIKKATSASGEDKAHKVEELAKRNLTLGEISRELGMDNSQVQRIAADAQVFIPSSFAMRDVLEKVASLSRQGYSLPEIEAQRVGSGYSLRKIIMESIRGGGKDSVEFQKLLKRKASTSATSTVETPVVEGKPKRLSPGDLALITNLTESTREEIRSICGNEVEIISVLDEIAMVSLWVDSKRVRKILRLSELVPKYHNPKPDTSETPKYSSQSLSELVEVLLQNTVGGAMDVRYAQSILESKGRLVFTDEVQPISRRGFREIEKKVKEIRGQSTLAMNHL